jgi:hypothetical protein
MPIEVNEKEIIIKALKTLFGNFNNDDLDYPYQRMELLNYIKIIENIP